MKPLLRRYIRVLAPDRVAPHKRVEFVEFVDVIPTSPVGKTLQRVLRDRARPVR